MILRSFFSLDDHRILSHVLSLFPRQCISFLNWLLRPYFKFSLILSLNVFVSIDLFSLKEILVMEKKCLVCWVCYYYFLWILNSVVFHLFCSVVSILNSSTLIAFLAMSLLLLLLLMASFFNGYGFLFYFFLNSQTPFHFFLWFITSILSPQDKLNS